MAECIGSNGDRWIIYQDFKGHWQWRRTMPDGAIVGVSSSNYADRITCEANAQRHGMDCTPVRQEENIKKLTDKIGGLLPDATHAGLATVFKDLKEESKWGVIIYTGIFCLFLLILFGITGYFLSVADFADKWSPWAQGLLAKLLFIAPVLWVVIFASKRRSEHKRLELEYTHKEAVSRSFVGYKEQIEALGLKDEKLLEELLSTVIKVIGYNPSATLGGSHGDNPPITEVANFFKFLKNLIKSSD